MYTLDIMHTSDPYRREIGKLNGSLHVNTPHGPRPQHRTRQEAVEEWNGIGFNSGGYNIFTRSFSQPSEKYADFCNYADDTEFHNQCSRTVSQPLSESCDILDINGAIHKELLNNPWSTYRRRPTRRDRYAMYVSNPDNHRDDEDFRKHTADDITRNELDEYYYNWSADTFEPYESVYATYRRAPRTFPRIDQRPQVPAYSTNLDSGVTARDRRRDGVVLSSLSDMSQELCHDDFDVTNITSHALHRTVDKQLSIQHLFSIKLNDIKTQNLDGRTMNDGDQKCGKLNKITNNLAEESDVKLQHAQEMSANKSTDSKKKKPFVYCRWVADYPKKMFFITFGGHMLLAILTVAMLLGGYDLYPTEFEILPMFDLKVPWLKRDFAWRFRDDYQNRYVRKWYIQGLNKWYRSMAYDRANVVLYYESRSGNIFTQENLKRIESFENEIANMANYSEYCVNTILQKCQKLTSVIRYFDGTYVDIDPVFRDPEFKNIPQVLYTARTHNATKGDFAYFLSEEHRLSEKEVYAPMTRTIVPMGFPIKLEQQREEMEDEMETFIVNTVKPTIKKLQKQSSGFKIIYWSFLLFKHDIVKQIFDDMTYAAGSVIFIFGFIVYHTKSLWISTLAVCSILTCFLGTNIIYRCVFDFRYFGFFHVITLYIILGIGADDLFVFLDVWKDTGFEKHESLAHRLSSAYHKSMKSMFYTSLTTTVAFIVNAISPLLATTSFGVFSALLVVINYISVVTYFPTVVIMHHLYFKSWSWPCVTFISRTFNKLKVKLLGKKPNTEIKSASNEKQLNIKYLFDDNSVIGTGGNKYNVVGQVNPTFKLEEDDEYGFVRFKNNLYKSSTSGVNNETITSLESGKSSTEKKKILVRFFRDHYFRFVTHWLIKWIIVITLSALVVFFSYCVSTIEADTKPVQFYRETHNYGKALDYDFNGFVPNKNDRNVVVYIVWGLKERDMSACHFSDPRCIGQESFDELFDPNSAEAQIALKEFCDKLHAFDEQNIDRFKIRRDFTTGLPEISCFARNLNFFLKMESTDSGMNWTMPWDYNKVISFMQSKSLLYNTLKFNSSFPNNLEIPISYWLNDGYRFQNKGNFNRFHSLIGEEIDEYSSPLKTDFSVFYGNRLMYLGVQVNLTLGRFSSGFAEGKPVMDRWEAFVQKEVSRMPPGLKNGFQLTKDYWHNLSVQKSIEDSAIFGTALGVALAFPLLTLATQNVVVGFFATLSMCCSTICVVGIIPLAGLKLGLLESLNMCMVVGLTVDYVVHLAEGYHMSERSDRKSRVQDMLETMGISVFSGACTTLGASIFMFFAQIQFIIRFGMFMFCTIGFSLLYSLGFFTTVMAIVGPNNEFGNIKVIFRKISDTCKKPCVRNR